MRQTFQKRCIIPESFTEPLRLISGGTYSRATGHLLEVLEDSDQNSGTIVISQRPVKAWYNMIGNAIVADILMERLVYNSHRIVLGGD
ncbi:ATP-binding protein [Vibrio parahaemolyticus]|nr:ATP-binding protein [Vibrio parahaemolyticus]HAS3051618.1 ATP-binding protein [Vibrio parahaemolyticus]